MISKPIASHKDAQILLRQIQFSWKALKEGNDQSVAGTETITEWNALTGWINREEGLAYNQLFWWPKKTEARAKLAGKRFSTLPFFTHLMVHYSVSGHKKAMADFDYWFGLFKDAALDGMDFSLTLPLYYGGEAVKSCKNANLRICSSRFRNGQDAEVPAHFTITAPTDVPESVLSEIRTIGFDEELRAELKERDWTTLNYRREDHPENALCLYEGNSDALDHAVRTFKEGIKTAPEARFYFRSMILGYGGLLIRDPDNPELQAIHRTQAERADRMLEHLMAMGPDRDWKFQIVADSEHVACGAGWDRRGSVLEHHETKLSLAVLRSGRKQHKLILHYKDGTYRVEIAGLEADSAAGAIIAGWGPGFE